MAAIQFPADDSEEGEAVGGGGAYGFTGGKGVACGFEIGAGGEGVALWGVHGWLGVVEVDAGHGFCDVEVARLAFGVGAVPIEDTVGGVGVLLDFMDEESGTNGVEASRLDKNGIALFGGNRMNLIGHGAIGDGFLEAAACRTVFEANI